MRTSSSVILAKASDSFVTFASGRALSHAASVLQIVTNVITSGKPQTPLTIEYCSNFAGGLATTKKIGLWICDDSGRSPMLRLQASAF